MEICVQIIDINPSISQLKTNKNDIISLILFDDETSEVIINLDKFIQKKDTLNFIVKNIDNNNSIKIKCTLVLNIKDILGVSEFLPKSNGIDLIQVNFVTNITEGNKITKQIYNTIQLIIKTDIKFRVGKSLIKTNSQKYFKKSFSLNQKINNVNNLNNKKNNKKNENINNIYEEENEDDNNNIDNNNDLYIERRKEKKASVKYSSKFMENLLKKKKFQNNKNEIEKIEKNIFSINDGNLENNNNNSGENKIFQRRKLRSITHSGKDNQSFRSKLYFSQENSKKNLQRFYITNNENKPILLNINNSNNFVNANNNSISNSGSNNNLKTYSSDDDFKQLKIKQISPEKINHKKSKFYVESDENININKNSNNNIKFEEKDETEKFKKIKNDLCVSHSQNYLNLIVDNNLKTEFKLVYKKLNDLQHIFHNDFLRINKNVKNNKQKFFIYFHRFHHVQKKFEKFNKIKENYEQKKYLENVKLKSIKLYNENFHIIKDVEIGFINNLYDILENKKASNKIDNKKKKLIKLFVEIIRKNKNSISMIDKKYYNKIKKKYFNK